MDTLLYEFEGPTKHEAGYVKPNSEKSQLQCLTHPTHPSGLRAEISYSC